MYYSKYNEIVEIDAAAGQCVLNNLYRGAALLMPTDQAQSILNSFHGKPSARVSEETIDILKSKGFVYESKAEEDVLIRDEVKRRSAILSGTNALRSYLILLSYGCNFKCGYCFQGEGHRGQPVTKQRLSKIFDAIEKLEDEVITLRTKNGTPLAPIDKPPRIGLIGGEPLQLGKGYMYVVRSAIDFSKKINIGYNVTTNGYHLKDYVPVFLEANHLPMDVQVTLDGIYEDHSLRRPHRTHKDSFERVSEGVEAAAAAGINVSLRVNVDKANVLKLSKMIDFFEQQGWRDHPYINPYIAPVTDHSGNIKHYLDYDPKTDIYDSVIELSKSDPRVVDVFKLKNFLGHEFVRSCVLEGDAPSPSLWRCEALLGQTVFDPEGKIYTCFESAGQKGAEVGTYDPELKIDGARNAMWRQFSAPTNPICSDCKHVFICAGGCPWNTIKTGKPECLSVSKQVKTAWNHYFRLANG